MGNLARRRKKGREGKEEAGGGEGKGEGKERERKAEKLAAFHSVPRFSFPSLTTLPFVPAPLFMERREGRAKRKGR